MTSTILTRIKICNEGGLILAGISSFVPLPSKSAKSLNGRKFEFTGYKSKPFFAQEGDWATFVGYGTKFKILSEIKAPLLLIVSNT